MHGGNEWQLGELLWKFGIGRCGGWQVASSGRKFRAGGRINGGDELDFGDRWGRHECDERSADSWSFFPRIVLFGSRLRGSRLRVSIRWSVGMRTARGVAKHIQLVRGHSVRDQRNLRIN